METEIKSKIRKILLPINIKLSVIVLLVTGLSLFAYVYLAVDMFKTDKVAYVFESVEAQNEQIAQGIQKELNHLDLIHQIFPEASKVSTLTRKILESNPQVLGYYEFINGKLDRKIIRKEMSEFDAEELLTHSEKSEYFVKGTYLVHHLGNGGLQSFLVSDLKSIKNNIPESKLYTYYFKMGGEYIGDTLLLDTGMDLSQYFHQTTVLDLGEKTIISVKPLLDKSIIFMTAVGYNKALSAASQLQKKSVYFAGLVAAFVIIVILILSGFFTRPIKKLYAASVELSKANFSFRVKLREKDEIGALGDSFNYMASEIEKYMEEMKEKTRLENELQTAKLVQKSFFPTNSLHSDRLKLDAFYQPASECGGDWWGHLKFNNTEMVILIDVTGHGTAAALMTGVIHNSLTALKFLCEKDPSYTQDPAKIMNFLNHSFCAVNINLNATAFVMIVKENALSYCNASHNPPFYIPVKEGGDYSKQDFIPLMGESGARLGESTDSQYTANEQTFKQRDHLILYTDGILEAQNADQKMYGNRNFIKSFSNNLKLTNRECLESSIADFEGFLGESLPDDDITLIKMEL